jgi:UPF0176 protein
MSDTTPNLAKAEDVPIASNDAPVIVAALYKFAPVADPAALRGPLTTLTRKAGLTGTLLLAKEGINGTVSGDRLGLQALLIWLRQQEGFADLKPKYSFAEQHTFYRMKVRLKQEIVSMGQPEIDPRNSVGRYVAPQEWNALIADPDTLVIDTRNHYEVAVGTFAGAVDPKTESFREFPAWVDEYLAQLPEQPKNIAMFCTGGIRCEKSTSYLVSRGYQNVFHLEGGILKYLETVPEVESKWEGECFVFDHRVSVGHGLNPGAYDMCHACRMPISEADKNHPHYQVGLSCPACYETITADQRARFAERQKQIQLARARGEEHIGRAQDQTPLVKP